MNRLLALLPQQGVQAQGQAIDGAFNTYYQAQQNRRGNQLLGLQEQNAAFNQERGNALLDIQEAQNARAQEAHDFQMDEAEGARLYKVFQVLSGLDPEQRMTQIELMKDGLRKRGFDDDDWEMLATDEGLAQGQKALSAYAPAPDEAKVGRYRAVDLPDGSKINLDSASGDHTVLSEGESYDINILPEGLRKLVADQPREVQLNAIKTYTNSDAFLKRSQLEGKQGDKDAATLANSTAVIEQIDSALEQTNGLTVGLGGLLSVIPGTSARDLRSTLDTIQANIGFAQLQAMRDNSPTGGALGNVTERELNRLESVLDSLDQYQSEDGMRSALNNIRESYSIARGIINGTITMPETQQDFDAIPEGSIYIDPDDGKPYRK